MNIERIKFGELWNEEAFQFVSEVIFLIGQHTSVKTKIDADFQNLVNLKNQMDELLEVIKKSYITQEIVDADTQRDNTYNSFKAIVKAYSTHFDENRKKAACKLKIVFDHYGELAKEGYNQETASLYNIIQELNNNFANELNLLRLQEWVSKLDTDNKAFETLLRTRDKETSLLPKSSMVELRSQIYEAYKKMINLINALFLVTNEDDFIPLINEFNACISRYNNVVNKRKSKKNNDNEDND